MQESKFMTILKRFVWLFPLIIVTIGIFYFMNLFERIYSRDLNRQIIEKNQLLTLTESLSSYQDVKHTILTLDTFTNIYTYMLYDEPDTLLNNGLLYTDTPLVIVNVPVKVVYLPLPASLE